MLPCLPVVFHPEAVEEAMAARLWYAERNQSAADSFLAELDHGIDVIAESPERFSQRSDCNPHEGFARGSNTSP